MPHRQIFTVALLPLLVATAAVAQQGTPIAAIPFETLPPSTQVVSSTITLAGSAAVHGDLLLENGGRVRYAAPIAHALQIGATEFASAGGTNAALEKDGYLHPSAMGLMSFVAPVRLPAGAQITDLYCFVYDNEASSDFVAPWVELRRRPSTALASEYVTAVLMNATGTSSVMQTFYPFVPFSHVVDDDSSYFLWLSFLVPAASADLRFYGCTLEYEVSAVSP